MPIPKVMSWLFGEEGDIIFDSEVQIMVMASGILVIGTTLLSPLISDLAQVYSISESRAGWLIIVYTAAGTIFIPVMGILADRIGRKRIFVPGLVLFGLAGAALGVIKSFEVAIGLRVIQAIGFGSAMPVTIALLGDLYTGNRETTGQGLRTAGINVAIMGIPFVSAVLFLYSWRSPFAIFLLALPIAGWAWIALPDTRTDQMVTFRKYLDDLLSLLSNRVMAYLLLSFVARFFLLYGYFTYISILVIREIGLTVVVAGIIVSFKGMISFISSTQAGRMVSYLNPIIVVLGGFVCCGAGLMLMGVIPTTATLIVGTALLGFGDGTISPTQKSLVNRIAPLELRSGAISIATTFQNLGKVIGPVVLGLLLNVISPSTAFLVFGAVGGVVGTGLLVGVRVAMGERVA